MKMETARVRDWLGELREAEGAEAFAALLVEAPAELRKEGCRIAGERWEGGAEWAEELLSAAATKPPSVEEIETALAEEPSPFDYGEASSFLPGAQPRVADQRIPRREGQPGFADRVAAEAGAEPKPKAGLPAVIPPPKSVEPIIEDAIAAMNERHAIIENVGGKTAIASWEPSTTDPTRSEVVFQSKESFLLRYSHRRVLIEMPGGRSVSVPVGQWWLNHRQRRQYRGVTFAPAGSPVVNDCLNTWQGWGVEARAGDWGLIQRHIVEVVASGNREFAEYVVRWIAWAIQHPDRQAEVALVLIGAKGAGKGTLGRCLQLIFGAHTFQVTSREEVIGKFNGHLQGCILFIADEAYWGGDKRCVGRLQGMITEPTLPIERKGFDVIQVKNYLHVMMLAEPGWVIPAGQHERRYAAFQVSPAKLGDRAYFKALHDQINGGGAEAMFYDLGRMALGDWHPRDIPEALLRGAALQKQQGLTLPPLEQWWLTVLHDGALPGAFAKRPNTAYTRSLTEDAKARVPRLRYDLTDVALRNFLVEEVGCTKFRDSTGNGWSFPTLAECRERYGLRKWDNPAEEWCKRSKLSLVDLVPKPHGWRRM
jgi:Mesyanzhinovviridae DNA primase